MVRLQGRIQLETRSPCSDDGRHRSCQTSMETSGTAVPDPPSEAMLNCGEVKGVEPPRIWIQRDGCVRDVEYQRNVAVKRQAIRDVFCGDVEDQFD